jgi:Ca-activated chloride channel family protein
MHLIAAQQRQDSDAAAKRRVVFILLSDGDDTASELEKPLSEVIRSRIKIYTVGLGTANGAYVPVEMTGGLNGQVVQYLQRTGGTRIVSRAEMKTMREISERTGGRFFGGENDTQIDEAIDEILLKPQPASGFQSSLVRKDLYLYFLIGAFGCLLAGVFL